MARHTPHQNEGLARSTRQWTAVSTAALCLASGLASGLAAGVASGRTVVAEVLEDVSADQPIDPVVYENRPVASVVFRAPDDAELSDRAKFESRNAVRTTRGDIFDASVLEEDVRRLNRLGLFGSVETFAGLNDDGTVTVVFEFAERTLVTDVQAVGNTQINDADIAAVVDVISGTPIDRFQIDRSARRIEELYRAKGYYNARITIDEEELADGGIVIFRIREGQRLRVTAIRFEGNQAFTRNQLKKEIGTKEANIFRKGQLDDDTLSDDIGNLITFYRDRGYLDVRADRILQPSPDGREAIITYLVEEGPLYTLRSVQVDIETDGDAAPVLGQPQVSGLIPIKPGDVYGDASLTIASNNVLSALGQMGYANARVDRVEKRDPESPVVDLIFLITEGPRSRVGEVIVQGNELTRQEIVRRQVQVRPMRPLDTTAIQRSERQLNRLRLFNSRPPVRITPLDPGVEFFAEVWDNGSPRGESEEGNGGDGTVAPFDATGLALEEPGRFRDVLIEVEETNTGEFNFGGAVSSDSGLIGRIALVQRNFDIRDTPDSPGEFFSGRAFRGGGQTFQLELLPGDRVETYSIGLTEPYLFESKYSGGAQVFFRNRDFDEFDEQRTGGRINVGRRFGTRWNGNLTLRVESVELSDLQPDRPTDVFAVADRNQLNGLQASLERSTLDSIVRPTRGSRTRLSVEQVLGDFEFTKFDARHTVFVPIREDYLGRPTVLSLSGQVGYIPQGNEEVPTYERFYLGGQSFRGFEFRTVSPKGIRNDNGLPSDDPVGGSWLLFGSAEIQQPIYDEILSLVFFVDAGTVTDDIEFDQWRVSIGAGLRLYIPQLSPAPLAFDFGFPIVKEDDDETRLFTFTVDLPF
ncbi:MAG: outer membrane protein assembly factor [Phycisphaerales bacterium]